MMIHNDKRKFIEHLADKAKEAVNIGNMKELYENTKLLSQKKWEETKPVKDKHEVLITNEGKQLQRWKEHFQEILKDTVNRYSQTSTKILTLRRNFQLNHLLKQKLQQLSKS
jgi:hypothetical protein